LRARWALGSFRDRGRYHVLRGVFRGANGEAFRVAHYSVQQDHIHLIIEADDKPTLSSGLRSVIIRIAMRTNKLLGRLRGKVWADRYHRRDLATPREVRNALVYVLMNHKKHLGLSSDVEVLDPFSSALWFTGWEGGPLRRPDEERSPTGPPRTWLLAKGWEYHGRIRFREGPRATSQSP
jgi:putative transposase